MAAWPYSTAQWRRLRLLKLRTDPLCEYCPPSGLREPAEQVDHRTPIRVGGDPWAWANLASTCRSCHSKKTTREDGGGWKRKKQIGCDANGLPLDAAHWWNGKIAGS